MSRSRIHSFEEKYFIEPNSGCWLWLASISIYGIFWNGKNTVSAHRWSYEYHKGSIPEGLSVCHKCDTPTCVNPEHLFLGTTSDNAIDRNRKNRGKGGFKMGKSRGENNFNSKLTENDVLEIRNAVKHGVKGVKLASIYGVDASIISEIKTGKIWKSIKGK